MDHHGLFVASTGQHVGKTTACLGLFSGLQKRIAKVGYMKPVGQEHVETAKGARVDKDVLLFKEHFSLKDKDELMSPVLVPSGFTRDFLDGKIREDDLRIKIENSFEKLAGRNEFLLVEGTGHSGVGSIINLNNAQVASLLKLPVLLLSSGGLGSAFDELSLNKNLCDKYGVKVIGVLLNRVLPEKQEMVSHYMKKALKTWKIPLIGCIPFDPFLSYPTMKDFEGLFETELMTGKKHRLRHFEHTRLVATSVETYRELIVQSQLIITPSNREDIILATLTKYWDFKIGHPHEDLESGMILTGDYPPRHYIVEELKKADIPMLYVPFHSHTAMQKINSFTSKIRQDDVEKVKEAIAVVEGHIDFDLLQSLL
ncbi:MAG: AAA family ATPase [Verrucomicrobia bacterium]|nr:AAA family ATPase [Verrucomicrobiota bacterium]